MTTQLLADALPELPKAIFWARNIDGRLELRAGEKPPNRACGYASPWAAMYDGPSVRDYAIQALAEHDAQPAQPAPAPVQPPANGDAHGVVDALPPLPPVDGYDKRVAGHYSAASMHAYARAAIAALQQKVTLREVTIRDAVRFSLPLDTLRTILPHGIPATGSEGEGQ